MIVGIALRRNGLFALAAVLATVGLVVADEPEPLLRWVFDAECQQEKGFVDQQRGWVAKPVGKPRIGTAGELQALALDGLTDHLLVASNYATAKLPWPRRELTITAWVLVDRPEEWGGVFSLLQDNGGSEQGWILGFDEQQFYFGLASKGADDGNGKLTYLRATRPYEPGRWHHVAAVYDGQVMQLYVDGQPAGKSTEQSGDILYPSKGRCVIGAYRDRNEFFPMQGAIRSVALYDRALEPAQVAALFAAEEHLRGAPPVRVPLHFFVQPYLQWPTTDGMTIMWETSFPADSTVEFGRKLPLDQKVHDGELRRIHEVRLTGLEPHTAYRYRVRSRTIDGQSVVSEVYTFRTAIGPDTPLAFAVIGDSRTYPKVYRRVCKAVWQQRPDIVLHVGDIVSDGRVKRQWIFECFRPAEEMMCRVALIPSLGNHERDAHWWYDYFSLPKPEYYFEFTYGNAHFLAVDTDRDLKPDSDQIRWLRERLAASTATWKFVYHHHPPFTADSDDYGDTAKGDSVWGDLKVRKALVPLYEQYGVDIVFDGHVHLYERTWPLRDGRVDPERGVTYVTLGGGGAELEKLAPYRPWFINTVRRNYHFGYVTISGKTLQYRAYDDKGRLFDFFELEK